MTTTSEFREDPVSGDWVILAPGRAGRPEDLIKTQKPRRPSPRRTCPFEDLRKSGNWPPVAAFPSVENWKIAVIPNKYPALTHGAGCAVSFTRGMYHAKTGVGDHEIVVTRDHLKNFADLGARDAAELFQVFRARHRALATDPCNAYVSTFFNWGPGAGASMWHPHYQILALPIVPPHVARSLRGAREYFRRHHRCVRCDIIAAERRGKERVVAENSGAIAFAPFAAKHAFEVSIFPKRHEPSLAGTPDGALADVAHLLQEVMRRMKRTLGDPDLNMFIHDAPLGRSYPYHHWHLELLPVEVVSPPGGFEAATVANINVVTPEAAATVLRGRRVRRPERPHRPGRPRNSR